MVEVSLISTIKVDSPFARLSLAPILVNIWSTKPILADAAGTGGTGTLVGGVLAADCIAEET